MLVDVVLVQESGKKLPAETVKATAPVRGRLIISTFQWRAQPNEEKAPMTFAYVIKATKDSLVPPALVPYLRAAHIRKLDDSAFIVVGIEKPDIALGKPEFAQAWGFGSCSSKCYD